jgi:hypothetical protein
MKAWRILYAFQVKEVKEQKAALALAIQTIPLSVEQHHQLSRQ